MKVVNPNNTTHDIQLISRVYPVGALELLLYNESTQIETSNPIFEIGISFTNNYQILDGYMFLKFDFVFEEGDKYQMKILENSSVIYRGKLIATKEETQTYLNDNNEYYYE